MARKSSAAVAEPVKTTRGRGPNGRYVSVPTATTAPTKTRASKTAPPTPVTPPKSRTKRAAPPTPAPTPPTVRLKNHIALVIDESSSMGSLQKQMVDVINSFIDIIKARSEEADQDTTISLCVFASEVKHPYIAADARNLKPLKANEYRPGGMTALLDGVGLTIEKLEALKDASDENTSFLVLPITDGEENYSRKYTENNKKLQAKLADLEKSGRWTIAFQVPKDYKRDFCHKHKIPTDSVREWETNSYGLDESAKATSQGVAGFFDARKTGAKKVDKFFTDLSKVTDKQVKAKLVDVRKNFRLLTVDKESPIKEFVEAKTGKPYVLGSAYYELTKPETVQPQKDVLIIERGKEKEAIYAGNAARDLLGLPQGEHARVTPANLSKWRPLIKSTSPNRKLVRGTILAVDLTKVMPDQAHFDTSVLDPK